MFYPIYRSICIILLAFQTLFSPALIQDYGFYLPEYKPNAAIYHYPGYSLQYNEKYEQADWVAYELTKEEVMATQARRSNNFLADPFISTGSATNEDYRKSGYDRGHLAPAADMKWSEEAMKSCFYYSNMSPQLPQLNRGKWASLEAIIRTWAVENEEVFVITGPIFSLEEVHTIGPNEVAIPDYFYKVVLDYSGPEQKGIGFILPHQNITAPLATYACTIDEVELKTGINFFPGLQYQEEILLEGQYSIDLWQFIEYSPHRNP